MDLFGPVRTKSLNGSSYCYVIIDDYSRYGWVLFLSSKSDAFDKFAKFCKAIENEKGKSIKRIRSDNGGEFKNHQFKEFCEEKGIKHEYSTSHTPQQNGVVERRNRTLQGMARTMLHEFGIARRFWAEAINTACHVYNRVFLRPHTKKTPYELYHDKKPSISYFKVFGCKCFILNKRDNLDMFDSKVDDGYMLG